MSTEVPPIHRDQPVRTAGSPILEANAAVILLHGRGATAEDILSIAPELSGTERVVFMAPQAAQYTWYPYSFLMPLEQNEPYLSSALEKIDNLMNLLNENAIPAERTMLLGFSQGACLALEYAARHAQRYGGVAGLSGGLIGPEGTSRNYSGNFGGTPVFLGCSDHDPHIPAKRVIETEEVYQRMGAEVTRRLYPHLEHTVNRDELCQVQKILDAMLRV